MLLDDGPYTRRCNLFASVSAIVSRNISSTKQVEAMFSPPDIRVKCNADTLHS